MLYCIIGEDIEQSLSLRMENRPAHLQRIEALAEQGRLVLAGPHPREGDQPGFTGSLIVAEFDSLEQAKQWAAQDPYALNGVFKQITVKPFRQVLP